MTRIPKTAIALFVVAAVLVGGRVVAGGQSTAALPDPAQMALLALERNTAAEVVDLWAARANEHPDNAVFHTRLATAQLRLARETGDLGGFELAESVAATAVALDPGDESARIALAHSRAGQHDFDGALAIAEAVLENDPGSVSALLAAGDALFELGRYDEAEESFRLAALELAENPPALLSRFARLEALRGNTTEASRLARRALIGSGDIDLPRSDAAFYWHQLANYEFRVGEIERAEELLQSALVADPGNLGATELLGRVLSALGKDIEAIAVYEGLLASGPAADLHGELAKLYERVGLQAAADAEIAAGLALADETADRFPAERRHLIGFLADHRPSEALRLAELDLIERDDVYSHAWYAWALLQTGEEQAALEALAPALAYRTDDPWLLYQAGSIHAANGNGAEAMKLLSSAVELNPRFDVLHGQRAEELLAELSASSSG